MVTTTTNTMSNFKKELQKAKNFYFNIWRGNEKPSPAFNGEIVKAGRAGWKHLRYSDRRNSKEILPRLRLLPIAKTIIETQNEIKNYRRVDNVEYWALEDMVNGRRIRVIIRATGNKEKHFFSVFSKRIK